MTTATAGQAFELSPLQQRLWLLEARPAAQAVLELAGGELDAGALRRAAEVLVRSHEVLRTELSRLPGRRQAVQVVRDTGEIEVREADAAEAAGGPDAAFALRDEERRRFEEARGRGLRLALAEAGPGRRLLVVTASSRLLDAPSLLTFLKQLADVLEGREPGGEILQYADFAAFQNEQLESADEASAGRGYWREKGDDLSAPLALPFVARSAPPPAEAATVRRRLGADELAALERAASGGENGEGGGEGGLAPWLTAALGALLHRRFGLEETRIAVESDGRSMAELEGALGLFARSLPLVRRWDDGEKLREAARQSALLAREARRWQDDFLWGESALKKAEVPPFPSVALSCRDLTEPLPLAGGSGELRWLDAPVEAARLRLLALRRGDDLLLEFQFDPASVEAEDAEKLADAFVEILAAAAEHPDGPVGELPAASRAEMEEVARSLVGPPPVRQPGDLIHRRIEAHARKSPSAPAVRFEGKALSYGELDRRANALAHRLAAILPGGASEPRALLFCDRSADVVVGLLACLKAGWTYVPVEPKQPAERLRRIAEEVAPAAVLTHEPVTGRMSDRLAGYLRDLDAPMIAVDDPAFANGADEPPAVDVPPESAAYVLFTSGSTGVPKGIVVEHRQLDNYAAAAVERLDLEGAGSFATVSTFAADLGNTVIFSALATGGCLHVVSHERAADAHRFGGYMESHEIDAVKVVPSHLEALLATPRAERMLPRRRLVLGGERLSWKLLSTIRGLGGSARVYNHYGPTEATVGVLAWQVEEGEKSRTRSVPLGSPLAGCETPILDRRLRPVATWGVGEIYIGGENLTRGYLGKPGLTADRFVPHPSPRRPGERLYRTGDQGRVLPGGRVEFLGRLDEQVKFLGFRIELNELRLALNEHPMIRDSVVSTLNDPQGRVMLVAYYVSRQPQEVAELRAFLRERVLEETIPNFFVHLRRLPLNLNGKVHYAALPDYEDVLARGQRHFVEPRSESEKAMAAIWCDVLGLPKISVVDSFFEMGGHSLLATRVISRVRESFRVDLPLRVLFESPTVESICGLMAEGRLAAVDDEGPVSLSAKAAQGPGDLGDDDIEAQLAELDELSDEQAESLLGGGS